MTQQKTLTISLSEYDQMREEIQNLKEKVEKLKDKKNTLVIE